MWQCDSLFFFGGYTRKGGTYFNDLFQYKVQENQWYEIRPIVAAAETIERRRQMYPDAEERPPVTA